MINFNFLGLGSFSGTQQKQKTAGVESAEGEYASLLLDGESLKSDAAFPNVLMQMLIGQQLPVVLPPTKDLQPTVPGMDTEAEPVVPGTPLFAVVQPISLQENLFAGEKIKQPAVQKLSALPSTPGVISIASLQGGLLEAVTLPVKEAKTESAGEQLQKSINGIEPVPIPTDAKLIADTIPILSDAVPKAIPVSKGANKETATREAVPVSRVPEVFIPKRTAKLESDIPVKETKSVELPRAALPTENAETFKEKFVRAEADTHVITPENKRETPNHVSMRKETVNAEPLRVSNSNDDIQQKQILASVVSMSAKAVKNVTGDSSAIDKSQSFEKQVSPTASAAQDAPVNTVKNEQQNSGNSSSAPKENMDRQPSQEKDNNSVAGRQGEQVFAAVVEEKSSMSVSKSRQTEVTTLLRQQDTVNNIFEQLAKNVSVSIDGNNSQIKISLKPEALGEVMLKVTIDQGKVTTQMEVQQPQVKAVIEANIHILRDSLSSRGLVVDRIDISTAQYSLNEKSFNHGQQRPGLKNYSGKEIADEVTEQTKLFGYNTVDYIA